MTSKAVRTGLATYKSSFASYKGCCTNRMTSDPGLTNSESSTPGLIFLEIHKVRISVQKTYVLACSTLAWGHSNEMMLGDKSTTKSPISFVMSRMNMLPVNQIS